MLPLVAIYESQVIPKGIKTNYFAPTKIHIEYKTIKIYNKKKNNHQKLSIINITFKHNHQNQPSKTIITLKHSHHRQSKTQSKAIKNNHKKQT